MPSINSKHEGEVVLPRELLLTILTRAPVRVQRAFGVDTAAVAWQRGRIAMECAVINQDSLLIVSEQPTRFPRCNVFRTVSFTPHSINTERTAWCGVTGRELSSRDGDEPTAVAYHSGGFIAGHKDGSLIIEDRLGRRQLGRQEGEISVIHCHGGYILTGSEDGHCRVWKDEEMVVSLRGNTEPIASVAMSFDHSIFTGTAKGNFMKWSLGGQLQYRNNSEHAIFAIVTDCSDVFTGHADGSIRVWRGQSGRLIRTIRSPFPVITAIAKSSELLAIGHANGIINLVNWPTGETVRQFAEHYPVMITKALFLADDLLVSSSIDGTVRTRRCNRVM